MVKVLKIKGSIQKKNPSYRLGWKYNSGNLIPKLEIVERSIFILVVMRAYNLFRLYSSKGEVPQSALILRTALTTLFLEGLFRLTFLQVTALYCLDLLWPQHTKGVTTQLPGGPQSLEMLWYFLTKFLLSINWHSKLIEFNESLSTDIMALIYSLST